MKKIIFKTQSVEEFLAKGGKITKVLTRVSRSTPRKATAKTDIEDADLSALPAALKIKFGIKG